MSLDVKQPIQYSCLLDTKTPISEEKFSQMVSDPAKEYPFELDIFQKQAIYHIHKGDNVFVSAHTSAGKTVVAEYAIAMALRNKHRVYYTSPIKALSNQKYRDLKIEFKDVGIVTGDLQVDPNSACVVMTTEVLLMKLYRNEGIHDLEFVIFDECHYVNDDKRGRVWEEAFIRLPKFTKLVLLSATVPNIKEFSEWLGRVRNSTTYLACTSFRPVPLMHYLYVGKNTKERKKFLILEGEGNLINKGFTDAMDLMNPDVLSFKPLEDKHFYLNLMRDLLAEDRLPAIIFVLSRNRCDNLMSVILGFHVETCSMINRSESFLVRQFLVMNLRALTDDEKKLPQIVRCSALLERGIGIHHSGILPILKEITEMLFARGLVRVLFATETFAMGVNMPARTVVFDSLEKFDGCTHRNLLPSEYIQMAGRAGRRGKDTAGHVFIACRRDVPSSCEVHHILKGNATMFESKFRLTYQLILTCLQSSRISIEDMLRHSFQEHSRAQFVSQVDIKRKKILSDFEALPELNCEICCKDIKVWNENYQFFEQTRLIAIEPFLNRAFGKKLIPAGKIVVLTFSSRVKLEFLPGIIVKVNFAQNKIKTLTVFYRFLNNESQFKEVSVDKIFCVLNKQIKNFKVKDLISEHETTGFRRNNQRFATDSTLQELDNLCLGINQKLLDTASNGFLGISKLGNVDLDTMLNLKNYEKSLSALLSKQTFCLKCEKFFEHFENFSSKCILQENLNNIEYTVSDQSLILIPEYNKKTELLIQKNFLTKDRMVTEKGQVACELSDHTLLLTELAFSPFLNMASEPALVAGLSCFAFEQGSKDEDSDYEYDELIEVKNHIIKICKEFGNAELELGISYTQSHCVDSLNFNCVVTVYLWAQGKSFNEVMQATSMQEGTVIRCIQRVAEITESLIRAFANIHCDEISGRFVRLGSLIRRDIAFLPSLYTNKDFMLSGVDVETKATTPEEDVFFSYEFGEDKFDHDGDDDDNELSFNENDSSEDGNEENDKE